MTRFSSFITAATFCFAATAGSASDNALYAEAAPADASFVRFVGFQGATSATYAGRSFDLRPNEAEAYIPISAAHLSGVDAGTFVTVIRQPNGVETPIEEADRSNKAKVFLFLVNATDQMLDLRLADGSMTVIEDVAGFAAGERAVNPVKIGLGVFPDGSDTPLAVLDVSMKRGQNLSFVADDSGVRLIEHRFGAVAK